MAGALCTAQGLRSLLHNSCSTFYWLPPTHSFLPISSYIYLLTFPYPRTLWILVRLPPVSIPFAFAPRTKLACLCNPHSRTSYPMLLTAALLLRRQLCKTRISHFTVHHTTVTHQPPRWTCRLKYSSSPTISCPPSPCCPARWRMTLSLPHPISVLATPICYLSAPENISSSAHSLTPIIPTNRSPAGSIVLEGRLSQHSPSF